MRITTERLLLRPFTGDDFADFAALIQDKLAGPFAAFDEPFPEDDDGLRGLLQAMAGTDQFLVAELAEDVRMIGLFSLNETDRAGERNFGFCLHSSCQHQGYAREAGEALLRYARDDLGLERLISCTAAVNAPSVRLLEALGFSLVSQEVDISFACDEAGSPIRYTSCTYIRQLY